MASALPGHLAQPVALGWAARRSGGHPRCRIWARSPSALEVVSRLQTKYPEVDASTTQRCALWMASPRRRSVRRRRRCDPVLGDDDRRHSPRSAAHGVLHRRGQASSPIWVTATPGRSRPARPAEVHAGVALDADEVVAPVARKKMFSSISSPHSAAPHRPRRRDLGHRQCQPHGNSRSGPQRVDARVPAP